MAVEIITEKISFAIDSAHESAKEMPRQHLGASMLGHPCDRWLWLSFRWAVAQEFPGRIRRLFRRGLNEEATIISDLESIGVSVTDTQTKIDFGSHLGGSIDGIVSNLPDSKLKHVIEFKTHSLKSFNDVKTKGVKESKPMHWAQMQAYMHGLGIHQALYFAVCKDDDRLHVERVQYDHQSAIKLIERGKRIATADRMPEPLSTDPTWYECKFCAAHEFCHKTKLTKEVHCRTCAHSTAKESGVWECAKFESEIPIDFQPQGCSSHVLHPDLVPWPLNGSDEDGWRAIYMVNGRQVKNGEPGPGVVSSEQLIKDFA